MSYAVQAPPAAAERRRPVTVTLAATLLAVMAVVGLAYAIVTLAVVPGVVSRFRADAGAAAAEDVDDVVLLVWAGAGVAIVLAVLLFALYVALALGLRRGSSVARVATLVVCGLGLLAGCGSALTVLAQRGSSGGGHGVGVPLNDAYPAAWVGLNVTLAFAQMLGYVAVAGLLLANAGDFFRRDAAPAPPAAPGPYGGYGALPGMPGLYQPSGGPPQGGQTPYGSPYGVSYGPPPTVAYGAPYGGVPTTPDAPQGPDPYAAPSGPAGGSQPASSGPGGDPGSGVPKHRTEPGPDDQFWARPSS